MKGSEIQVNRLQRELVALHQIIEAKDEELAKLREENHSLHADELTGLFVRRMFKVLANQDLAQARRRAFLKDAEDWKSSSSIYPGAQYVWQFSVRWKFGKSFRCFGADGSEKFPVTISVGVSYLTHPDDTLESLIKRADDALYYGKQHGRDH